jgi:DMSO reductase family type II enzyme chaperone
MMETMVDNQSIPQTYLFLSKCFSYPKREFHEAVGGVEAVEELDVIIERLPFEVDFKGIPSPSLPQEEFESEYVNTFDIAGDRPLYESAYTAYRDDMCSRDIYEDILRFYEHFNIKLADKEKDYPDHISAELEFMAFLAKKEAEAVERGKDAEPYRLAQRDFLERHLNKWVHKLNERIQKRIKEPFYRKASAFMVEFIRNHLLHLKEEARLT